jgi:hypothetical protein
MDITKRSTNRYTTLQHNSTGTRPASLHGSTRQPSIANAPYPNSDLHGYQFHSLLTPRPRLTLQKRTEHLAPRL